MTMPAFTAFRQGPIADVYPSRAGREPRFLERLDPVVYARNPEDCPVGRRHLEHYAERGYVVLDDVFSAEETRLLQRELEGLRTGEIRGENEYRVEEPDDQTLRSIFAIHRSNDLFDRLSRDARLVNLARYILDDDVYLHQTRLNYKPGFRGKEFYWHSDFETWHVEDGMPRMRALSMSIILTQNSPNNGPLMLIPGSQTRYVSCSGLTPEDNFRKSLRKQEYGVPDDDLLRELVDEGGIMAVDARPGSVIVFDCNTMHGSNSNITPYPRSNAFFVFNALSNRVVDPFSGQRPRPEAICTREPFIPLESVAGPITAVR